MSAPLASDLRTGLRELARVFERRSVRYAVIGGIACGIRGRPRFTEDIDIVIDVPQLQLPALLEALIEAGFRCDPLAVIPDWIQHGMLQMHFGDVAVDWLKPVLPCFAQVIERARVEDWMDVCLRVASAEDLIIMKLLARRSEDIFDIENLLRVNRPMLDLDTVRAELAATLPDDSAAMLLEQLLARIENG